ncbi:NAD(P)/FAD-dependent oxidoreductase [Frigidibacter mobilis]|uniref:NADH:ubiquinone reductase (non-electrogenic) n=1 Tax=Frigidibacter mobilis TaxID=1335048 RepID=A0A159Z2Q6_9RHOB|nr:NAD(P)/FAD-dependent oxidoreductase [Frigidibacter mobilis]AMY69367.1 putative FAD-dependent pyridine nucleotide-disulfide oxidoreductase protein [Frigidibacter mobilis]
MPLTLPPDPITELPGPDLGAEIVIVGGGFAGLACALELGGSELDVLLIDARNHNLFQPLLYQVATAALSPADISEPIRRTLGRHRNLRVLLGRVTGADPAARELQLADGRRVGYGQLVLAAGSDYNYFGHDDWRAHAPGLKTVHEARLIRQRLLLAFEKAEHLPDPDARRDLLTTVIVGGGPTGVEMAGAVAELGRFLIGRDFRGLFPDDLRILLVEAGPRILAGFPEKLSRYAADELHEDNVEIWTDCAVEAVGDGFVTVGGRRIAAGCVIWAAGVKAVPVAGWLGAEPGKGGRLPVGPDLGVTGYPGVWAIGDAALALDKDGAPLPPLAQVARQQGQHLGCALRRQARGGPAPGPFQFRNRGNTAVIGRGAAVFDFGRWQMKGSVAWYLWALVHVWLLVNFEKRLLVSLQWAMRYVTRQRSARLIDETADAALPATTDPEEAGPPEGGARNPRAGVNPCAGAE